MPDLGSGQAGRRVDDTGPVAVPTAVVRAGAGVSDPCPRADQAVWRAMPDRPAARPALRNARIRLAVWSAGAGRQLLSDPVMG